ncbi:MAG: right-handed parallel beta-helix repeat-containing protein [Pseudomonadota bacterium]
MTTIDVHGSEELKAALAQAEAGWRIRLAPGLYPDMVETSASGSEADPIVLEPLGDGWIDGGKAPTHQMYDRGFDNFALIRFQKSKHIKIEKLHIKNCWPAIFQFKDCNDITIAGNKLLHGTNAILVRRSMGFVVMHNSWHQDDSKDHKLWHEVSWVEAHGGEGGTGSKQYYNGSFFSGKDSSDILIRDNLISDCYNGVRIKVDVIPAAGDKLTNANVRILANRFVRVRDNPIEPERYAYNWHVAWNHIEDAHAWFSFDGVRGGFVYIYGNTAFFKSRQGLKTETRHTMGRVLKLSYVSTKAEEYPGRGTPDFPWYVMHNSFVLRCPIIGGAARLVPTPPCEGVGPNFTTRLNFKNNVFQWCDPSKSGSHVCEWISMFSNFERRPGDQNEFDGSLTNRADYLAQARSLGLGEAAGLEAHGPLFTNPSAGNFELSAQSPGRSTAAGLDIATPCGETLKLRTNEGGKLHRGAIQDYGFVALEGGDEPPTLPGHRTA